MNCEIVKWQCNCRDKSTNKFHLHREDVPQQHGIMTASEVLQVCMAQ